MTTFLSSSATFVALSTATALTNQTIITSTDTSMTLSTVLGTVNPLSVNLTSATKYGFEARLYVKSGASAGGVVAGMNGSATATSIIYSGYCLDTGATPVRGYAQVSALGGQVASAATTSDATTIIVSGTINVNAAGTLNAQFAQSGSNATPTVIGAGSKLTVIQTTS